MSIAKDKIENAYQWALANRPKINGYPYLAEALRQAGVTRYVCHLPSCQCIYFTQDGNVVNQMEALINGMKKVPPFDKEAFIKLLRKNQMGESTFPEFLQGAWKTGVISYEADLNTRKVSYYGAEGEMYIEAYPAVEIKR